MATTLIQNGAFNGALGAILSGRPDTSGTPADYAGQVNAADAFATQFLTANAALAVPMADADNAQIGELCESAARAVLSDRFATSTVATDYATPAAASAAAAKQGAAKLV
ncbi:MAG: hypothetical protein ACREBG_01885 [Pyrinomonadaceae bacterium]